MNFRKASGLPQDLPLPSSNTRAAKDMRALAVLTFLSRLLDEQIFCMLQILPNDAELRQVLLDQASVDEERERLCRALLLSLLRDKQLTSMNTRVADIVHDASSVVSCLVPQEAAVKFASSLSPMIQEVASLWWDAQRCKEKLVANIRLATFNDWEWETFQLPLQGEIDSVTYAPEKNSITMVVFPGLFVAGESGYEPLYHGLVVREWQLRQAKEEIASTEHPGPAKSQVPLARSRSIARPRKSASTGCSEDKNAKPNSFLDGKR